MANHNDIGKWGEDSAVEYLHRIGYTILERNWRHQKSEIDIIAMNKDVLIIIEVKSRTSEYFASPEESVNEKKMRFLTFAAGAYMEKINHDWEVRFDIISVLFRENQEPQLTHFKDAFFLGLSG